MPVWVRVRVRVGVRLCVEESDWLRVCDCDEELDCVPVGDGVDVVLGESVDERDCVGVFESVPLGSCVPVVVGVRESVGVAVAVAL